MLKHRFLFAILAVFLLCGCDTIISKKTLKSEPWIVLHAGKEIPFLLELKEIRTSKQSEEFWLNRDVSYSYACFLSLPDGKLPRELYALPCDKIQELSAFAQELRIQRSKDRSKFLVQHNENLAAVIGMYKGLALPMYIPVEHAYADVKRLDEIDLERFERPRALLENQVSGGKRFPLISGDLLTKALQKTSPHDGIAYAFAEGLAFGEHFGMEKQQQQLVCQQFAKNPSWAKHFSGYLQANRDKHEPFDYAQFVYSVKGKKGVYEEDKRMLQRGKQEELAPYFIARKEQLNIALEPALEQELKTLSFALTSSFCEKRVEELERMHLSLELAHSLNDRNVFNRFLNAYRHSPCKARISAPLNNSILFSQYLSDNEKRQWAKELSRHFALIPQKDMYWVYQRIKEYLPCHEQRELVLKYGKEMDSFHALEVPACQ